MIKEEHKLDDFPDGSETIKLETEKVLESEGTSNSSSEEEVFKPDLGKNIINN